MDDVIALMNQRLTDLERRVAELEAERNATVLDNVTDTVATARKGLGSLLSKASKAIGGDSDR